MTKTPIQKAIEAMNSPLGIIKAEDVRVILRLMLQYEKEFMESVWEEAREQCLNGVRPIFGTPKPISFETYYSQFQQKTDEH